MFLLRASYLKWSHEELSVCTLCLSLQMFGSLSCCLKTWLSDTDLAFLIDTESFRFLVVLRIKLGFRMPLENKECQSLRWYWDLIKTSKDNGKTIFWKILDLGELSELLDDGHRVSLKPSNWTVSNECVSNIVAHSALPLMSAENSIQSTDFVDAFQPVYQIPLGSSQWEQIVSSG